VVVVVATVEAGEVRKNDAATLAVSQPTQVIV
jgi:hypothetical protein